MRGYRIKSRFVFILLLIVFVIGSLATFNISAHPASDLNLSYDLNNQELTVEITHRVSDPQTHFIDNITIRKNGEVYEINEYTSQLTDSIFTYTYKVNASIGDELEVFTNCNLGGTLIKQISISSEKTTEGLELTIEDINYYSILGLPFILHLGIFTLIIFILTALLPLLKRWKIATIDVKWHIRLAYVAIVLGIIHGILGIIIYL
jgi:desulfoferrodoxin (superoxide reductase-like protein)